MSETLKAVSILQRIVFHRLLNSSPNTKYEGESIKYIEYIKYIVYIIMVRLCILMLIRTCTFCDFLWEKALDKLYSF